MKRLVLMCSLIVILLVSCTSNDKTVILNNDTSGYENSKYLVESKELNISQDDVFIPGYYDENKLYGLEAEFNKDGYALISTDGHSLLKNYNISYYDFNKSSIKSQDVKVDDFNIFTEGAPFDQNYIYYDKESNESYSDKWIGYNNEYVANNKSGEKRKIQWNQVEIEFDKYAWNEGPYTKFVDGNNEFVYRRVLGSKTELKDDLGHEHEYSVCSIDEYQYCSLEVYDVKNEKAYNFISKHDDETFKIIEYIFYSDKNQKFYGINRLGELYELKLNGERLDVELIYNIPLEKNEVIQVADGGFSRRIITGNKVLFQIVGAVEDEEKNYSYFVKGLQILDLESLEIQNDFNESIDGNFLKFESGLALIQTSDDNYALIDLREDKAEVIKVIPAQDGFRVWFAASDDAGERVTVQFIGGENLDKSKLIEFNIEKLQ